MVDANGDFVIGNTVFYEDLMYYYISVNQDSFGFANDYTGAGDNYIFEMDYISSPPEIDYTRYDSVWGIKDSSSFTVGTSSHYKTTYDYNRSIISFIISEDYGDTSYSVIFHEDFFPNVITSIVDLLDYPTSVSFSNLYHESICYTEDGITGVRHDSELRLISFETGDTIDTYEDWNKEDLVYAYDLSGEYFYYFDINDRTIHKSYTWWEE